jgi:hypothetical protein
MESKKLRRIVFPESRNILGKGYRQLETKPLPGTQIGKHIEDIKLTFLPDMEVVEVESSNMPTIWISRDQIFSMEPEQDKVHPGEVPVVEPEAPPVAKPMEGARSSLDAPLPDLRPPPKEPKATTLTGMLPSSAKPDRFAKVGKKRGRPKKVKKNETD